MSDNRGPQVSGVSGVFLALTWIFVSLRIYCRLVIVKCFGIDDFLALIAQLLFTLFCAFAITAVKYGMGQHTGNIQPPTHISIGLKWWWICEITYVLSNLAIKLSICLFLWRIAASKTPRVILMTVIAVSGVTCSYFLLLFIFQCRPIIYFWAQYTGVKGSCINAKIITTSTYIYSAVRCCSDWTCCILPACMVWKLQMNPRTKFSVCLILGLGAIASIATIIRIPYIRALSNGRDFLYASTDVAIWSLCETGLAIIASACTTLRPLLTRSSFIGSSQTVPLVAYPNRYGNFKSQRYEELGRRSDSGKEMGITTMVGNQSEPVEESGSPPLSTTGIRKTVVVSMQVDTRGPKVPEKFSV